METDQLVEFMQHAPEAILGYGMKLVVAIVIFLIGRWVAKLLSSLVRNILTKRQMDVTVTGFIGNIVSTLVMIVTLIAVLGKLGVETASLVAVLGAAGLAVGLALQGSLSNFASGVLLVTFRPCRAGDYIEAAGVAGTVQEINIFSTTLLTPDNKRITCPNSSIMNDVIVNFSAMDTRRVDLVIGVAYHSDLQEVKAALSKAVSENSLVLAEPAPTIEVSALADSSINFVVRPWVNSADYWTAYFGLHAAIKVELDKAGISIPFPQMDVHVKQLPAQNS